MMHYIKYLLLKSYRDKFNKERKMRVVGYGEIHWVLLDDDGVQLPKMYSVLFYENDLGERKYNVNAADYEKKFYWHRLKAFHECELWKSSGIKPAWYEDILQKKLIS